MNTPTIKITLTFKGRLLAVFRVTGDSSLIGRDPACEIVIDSLAVAPRHAQIRRAEDGLHLAALDPDHPVFLNGQPIDSALLADGDLILLGKHTLGVSLATDSGPALNWPPKAPVSLPTASRRHRISAYLQVQSGPTLGKVIHLRRAVTRLKGIGGDEVIVNRRGDHYLLTRIGEANRVAVAGELLHGDMEVALRNSVRVEVDGIHCQFFDPAVGAEGVPGAVLATSRPQSEVAEQA